MSPHHEELYQRVAALGRVRKTVLEGNYSSPKGKKFDFKVSIHFYVFENFVCIYIRALCGCLVS